jgi:hypothetical protein
MANKRKRGQKAGARKTGVPRDASEIIRVIDRPVAQIVLKQLGKSKEGVEIHKLKGGHTRKQYYFSLGLLRRYSMIQKKRYNYRLTPFGRVIYNILLRENGGVLNEAIKNYWKIYALGKIENESTNTHYSELMDQLIQSKTLKNIIQEFKQQQQQQEQGEQQQQKQQQ